MKGWLVLLPNNREVGFRFRWVARLFCIFQRHYVLIPATADEHVLRAMLEVVSTLDYAGVKRAKITASGAAFRKAAK